jgi:hypothetical protein
VSDVQIAARKRAEELAGLLPIANLKDLLAIAFLDGALHGFDNAIATRARVEAIYRAKRA